MIEIDANDEYGSGNNGSSDHEGKDFSDPNLDEVSDDIDDKGANNGENVYASSVGNSGHDIVIYNACGAHT